MLNSQEVKRIAELARISLSDQEIEKFRTQLAKVLDYVSQLKAVDTEGLEEVSQVTGLVNVQREDKVLLAENHQLIMSQAPSVKDGYFQVKAIL